MHIHAAFDGGNIEVLAISGDSAQLAIKPDTQAAFRQWFYFCVEGGQRHHLSLVNVKDSSYPGGWQDYQAVASHDRQQWFRVPTVFDGEQLHINYQPQQPLTFYAYFEPYSYERYLDFVARIQSHCDLTTIATSCDGRALHLLTIGKPAAHKRKLWFIARQHAGEIMASWFIEALVAKLINSQDSQVKKLLTEAVIYIVPHMNPDGASRGHLRANARGIDLNRQWADPSAKNAPEVFYVRQAMQQTGVDFFLDIHGDETLPYVFLAYDQSMPSFSERQARLCQAFSEALVRFSVDFQTQHGYEQGVFGAETTKVASNHVAAFFDCPAFTLEMPFKDNANWPDAQYGWSKERSQLLAQAVVPALLTLVPQL